MIRLFIFISTFLILFSCRENTPEIQNAVPPLLRNRETKELPLIIRPCGMTSSGLASIEPDSAGEDGFIPYGTFKGNGDYYVLISLGMADCTLPMLSTYDSKGNKIDEKVLSIGGCNTGPGYRCSETVIIRKDYSIYSCDSIVETELDATGQETGSVKSRYNRWLEGKLEPSGKILLSDEKRQELPH